MNRFLGSKQDSENQATERNRRQARRNIKRLNLDKIGSDSDEFHDCDTSRTLPNLDGNDSDTSQSPNNSLTMPPAAAVKFQDENEDDDADYYKKITSLKSRLFNKNEVEFWFTSIEASLKHMGVKSHW